MDDQGGQSSSPSRVKNFHFSMSSIPILGPTQPPIHGTGAGAEGGGGGARLARKSDITICEPCLDNVGSLTSHNPIGLHVLLQG
jgi:hypothetical protein